MDVPLNRAFVQLVKGWESLRGLDWHAVHLPRRGQLRDRRPDAPHPIDPFLSRNPLAPCAPDDLETPDVILVSHAAFDHYGDTASIAKRTGAPVVCDADVRAMLIDEGVPPARSGDHLGDRRRGRRACRPPGGVPPLVVGTLSDGRRWSASRSPSSSRPEPGVRVYHYGDTCHLRHAADRGAVPADRGFARLLAPARALAPDPRGRRVPHWRDGADEAARTAEMLGLEIAVACHYLAKDAEVERFLELVPKYDTSGRRQVVAPEVGQDARGRRGGLDARGGGDVTPVTQCVGRVAPGA